MAEEFERKKVSELPSSEILEGMYTLGVDANNNSVKVSLLFVKSVAEAASASATAANIAKDNAIAATNGANTATSQANEAANAANGAAASVNEAKDAAITATSSANSAATSANTATDSANTATDNANAATSSANSAATSANTAAAGAVTAKNNAETATIAANDSAESANSAAASANTATDNASAATSSANSAATSANTATDNANAASSSANSAATSANTATDNANAATSSANSAATNANTAATEVRAEIEDIKKFVYSRNMYGVEFMKGALDPDSIKWIGDEQFKSNHTILNQFKVAKVKNGAVVGFLNQTNWFKMEDGTDSNVVIDGIAVTDDGSDIMLVNPNGFYVINGGSNETYERRLVSDTPFTYDDDAAVYVPPFGMSVDYAIVKDGVQRSIRDNSHTGTGAAGVGGISYLADGLASPTTYVSRFNYERYAQAKNADNTKNLPYANAFQFDINVWATLLFIKFQTKDLHASDCLGGCISSNDSAPVVDNWGEKTGIRVSETGGGYTYYNISSSRFRATSESSNLNFWQLLNNYRPLLKMFDAQLALSHAVENNIEPDTEFAYDGYQWSYSNVIGSDGISNGEMTAKVRKHVAVSFSGYDHVNATDVVDLTIDYCLEQAIILGKIAGWGNCFQWVSGIDCKVDGTNNNEYTLYQTNDVEKLMTDTESSEIEPGDNFDFENQYELIGTRANGSGYNVLNFDDTVLGATVGGSLHTGECAYNYYSGSATEGKLARRGVRFGGCAHYGYCSLRCAHAAYAPSNAYSSIAGGFRVRLAL